MGEVRTDDEGWLDSVKRRVYGGIFAVVLLATLSVWALDWPLPSGSWVWIVSVPVVIGWVGVLAIASLVERVPMRVIEAAALFGCEVTLVALLSYALLASPRPHDALTVLLWVSPWTPAILLGVFVTFELRAAVGLATASVALLAAFVLAHYFTYGRSGGAPELAVTAASTGLLSVNAFFATGLFLLARLKHRYGEMQAAQEVLTRLANTDELTGIANRRNIIRACDKEMARRARNPRPFSAILFDIDHFKRVNDKLGHPTGDEVLKRITDVMNAALREGDDFGRLGGEEFLILAYDTDLSTAASLADRLRAVLASDRVTGLPRVTASFGVTAALPDDSTSAMLSRADRALYAAKQRGRDRVEVQAAWVPSSTPPP